MQYKTSRHHLFNTIQMYT